MTTGADQAPAALRRRRRIGAGLHPAASVGRWAFLAVVVASLGGPLALAALYAPSVLGAASVSAGFVNVVAAVVFAVPLVIWWRYSRVVATSGGLFGFVQAVAGRRLALLQAVLWIISYLLYLLYTTAFIVYDLLPEVLPGVGPYQRMIEVGLPVLLALVMLAGRTVAVTVIGALAAGQLLLVGVLAVVTIVHNNPVGSFARLPPAGAFAAAAGQTALLYVCGSLPLFLGGEVVQPRRTVARGLLLGYLLVVAGVLAAVSPLAANPAFTRAPIPGMAVARVFSGPVLAVIVGLGVAASVAGVMLVEFLALSRLLHAVSGRPTRIMVRWLAGALAISGPLALIDPDMVYESLLKPSLIALWLSQLIVFACYPGFAIRRGGNRIGNTLLGITASLLALYGLYTSLLSPTS